MFVCAHGLPHIHVLSSPPLSSSSLFYYLGCHSYCMLPIHALLSLDYHLATSCYLKLRVSIINRFVSYCLRP